MVYLVSGPEVLPFKVVRAHSRCAIGDTSTNDPEGEVTDARALDKLATPEVSDNVPFGIQ